MRLDLLTLLADHLDTIDTDTFDMRNWKCGYKACAIGHACTLPEFNKAGLYLLDGPNNYDVVNYGPHNGSSSNPYDWINMAYDAVESVLELSFEDTFNLFSPYKDEKKHYNQDPKAVANEIREFVRQHSEVKANGE